MTKVEGGDNVSLSYGSYNSGYYHRPQSVDLGGTSFIYSYDQVGNITADGRKTHIYDNSDRLSQVNMTEGATSSFLYNSLGARLMKKTAGEDAVYYLSPNLEVIIKQDGSFGWRRNYFLGGKLVAVRESLQAAPDVWKMFVSGESIYTGNMAGIAGADQICQTLADSASLTGTYSAWLSDSTTDGKDKLAQGKYTLVDGTVVANSKTDLLDGSLLSQINKDEYGQQIEGTPLVWTGSKSDGTKDANFCNDWSSESTFGDYGRLTAITSKWTDDFKESCLAPYRLYCIQTGPGNQTPTPLPSGSFTPVPSQSPQPRITPSAIPSTPTPVPAILHRAFVTKEAYTGNLGGLSGADGICKENALLAGLPGSYVAWLSTDTIDAKDRIPDWQYALSGDGNPVISKDKADLLDGVLLRLFNTDADGKYYAGQVWTGTKADGTKNKATCNNWSSTTTKGSAGTTESVAAEWTESLVSSCQSAFRFYCFENVSVDNTLD